MWQRAVRRLELNCRRFSTARSPRDGMELLYNRIKLTGPITVASYMKECLLNPITGYYMNRDMFGAKGDFITSPEISQVFGELLAVWVIADWMVAGEPVSTHLVELGPGRGTLTKDMLRVFGQFSNIQSALSVHLVDTSPYLSDLQEATLTGKVKNEVTAVESMSGAIPYKSVTLDSGVRVFWYQRLEDVPTGHCYIIAHEFFDALPVHQFQRTPSGWREIMVDVDPLQRHPALRFVLAPGPTPAVAAFSSLLPPPTSERREVELCPEGLVAVKEVGRRVVGGGGAALVGDYGQEVVGGHTLRGFKGHELHHVLKEPGSADMTADVNFSVLSRAAQGEGAGCFGPMTQNEFLHKMGIRQRMQALLKAADSEQARDILTGYEMLTSPEQMGERFKFLTITSSPSHIPAPFAGVDMFDKK